MKRWALILTTLALVGCSDLPSLLSSGDTAPAQEASDPTPDTGYVFDDERPSAPANEADNTADPAPSIDGSDTIEPLGALAEDTPVTPTPEVAAKPEKPDQNAAARLACTRKKGNLTKTPAGFFVCVTNTGQGQKACTSSNQCKGVCLARSGTCAPYQPLIGCNEVITGNGKMQTLCID